MGIQVKFKVWDPEADKFDALAHLFDTEVSLYDIGGEIIIKVDGRVLYQSGVDVDYFWSVFLHLIETFSKKEKKTVNAYQYIYFCINKAKRKE